MADPILEGMNATIRETTQPTSADNGTTVSPKPEPRPAVAPGPPAILGIEFTEKAAIVVTTVGSAELTLDERAAISRVALKAFQRMLDAVLGDVRKSAGVKKRSRKGGLGRPKLPRDAQGNIVRPAAEATVS